jgi:hypothetical protein
VNLASELSGPNYGPRKLIDGISAPHRITVQETYSLAGDTAFVRFFVSVIARHDGEATHMVQPLGKSFMLRIVFTPQPLR